MIRAVIFDLDETLYAYSPCDRSGVEAMRLCLSEIMETDVAAGVFRRLLSEAKQYVKSNNRGTAASHNRMLYAQRICETVGCFCPESVLKLYQAYWDRFLTVMRLRDGVEELLEELHGKCVKVGICTDLTAQIQLRKLSCLGLSARIDALVTSEECGAEKPDVKPFRFVLDKLEVCPEDAVMVGDDYEKDILGAEAAGMRAVQLTDRTEHVYSAQDFSALSALLGRWII
ncbi:MAG: HAD family hydrolase [Oscillospiraceae bacterium]|nr:HAD family hydrolase [Oscillospiraceae bacterium]